MTHTTPECLQDQMHGHFAALGIWLSGAFADTEQENALAQLRALRAAAPSGSDAHRAVAAAVLTAITTSLPDL